MVACTRLALHKGKEMRDMTEANRAEFEAFMAERFTDSIDRRRCINGDGNDYMSWDMGVARAVWQHMQQKLDAVLAENVIQKSGVTYFAFAPEYGFDYFTNKQDAINVAQAEIDHYREDAFDGWDEDVRRVSWGIVIQKADGFDAQGLHITDSQHTYQTCDYHLVDEVKTPATDAILNAVRAEAIEQAAEKAPWLYGDQMGRSVEAIPKEQLIKWASQLRAETDATPSQDESLAGGK